MPKCSIPNCDNEMECPSTGTCKLCYQSILNWTKRKPDEAQERAHKLAKYAARMQTILPSNVELLRPKKVKIKAMPGTIKVKHEPKKKVRNG